VDLGRIIWGMDPMFQIIPDPDIDPSSLGKKFPSGTMNVIIDAVQYISIRKKMDGF
jgi:hypothetical protein